MATYVIMNENDPTDTFLVEARSAEEAAFQALGYLGWCVDMSVIEEEIDEILNAPVSELLDDFVDIDDMMDIPPEDYTGDEWDDPFEEGKDGI